MYSRTLDDLLGFTRISADYMHLGLLSIDENSFNEDSSLQYSLIHGKNASRATRSLV